MQFSTLATLALISGSAMANYPVYNGTVNGTGVVTEVVTAFTTYCPAPTVITVGPNIYNVTKPGDFVIHGPITVMYPVTTIPVVECKTCPSATPTGGPSVYPTAPVYPNSTMAKPTVGTTYVPSPVPTTPGPVTANSGNKVVGMSGAALAGLLGVAAYIL